MWRRYAIRDRIRQLNPKTDCQEIIFLVGTYEFPWLIRKSLEYALFRGYAIPSISTILDRTGQFREHGQRRYDDTALLMAELVENGYDSPRGRQAIRMMNRLHQPHGIRNSDMLYVLSTFVFEPIHWVERYGWRPLLEREKWANFHFWFEVGQRMAIQEIPETMEAFAQFQREYEEEHYTEHPANHAVAEATIAILQAWYPRFTYLATRWAVYSLLNDPAAARFRLPEGAGPAFVARPWRFAVGGKGHALPAAAPPTLPVHGAETPQLPRWLRYGGAGPGVRAAEFQAHCA